MGLKQNQLAPYRDQVKKLADGHELQLDHMAMTENQNKSHNFAFVHLVLLEESSSALQHFE